jgi:hypothetical protein
MVLIAEFVNDGPLYCVKHNILETSLCCRDHLDCTLNGVLRHPSLCRRMCLQVIQCAAPSIFMSENTFASTLVFRCVEYPDDAIKAACLDQSLNFCRQQSTASCRDAVNMTGFS